MKFYTKTHKFYCGIDLHAKTMYLRILDQQEELVKHKNIRTTKEAFLDAIAQYREDIVSVLSVYLPGIGL
ncbi:MAG: hypothetical protein QY310_12625 [Candidatus Jettenia sp. CY-1]|nr:hypothetical protein [Candidatus Jettenia sp.]WKZ18266.1 MAG: hypothetical protein QY310_12625 [Candidatus Jettenia sp. CY-1]